MTATTANPHVARPVAEVAPGLVTRVREGDLGGVAKILLGIGAVGLAATLVGVLFLDEHTREQALFSYLVAYMFTLGIALGGLFFVMIQHITRAGWSVTVRRIAEHFAGLLPWMALLGLPVLIFAPDIFHHWWHAVHELHVVEQIAAGGAVPEGYEAAAEALRNGEPPVAATIAMGGDPVILGKAAYLNPTFFYVRAVIYFAVWTLLARFFRNTSLRQDESGDPGLTMKMALRSAPALLVFAITLTFAAFDWIMALDPHWFSTIFGITYFAGGVMALLAALTLVTMFVQRKGYLREAVTTEHYHDLGKLLFAFMVFWTYVNFSQYMLIWYANLPEETLWYEYRAATTFDGHSTLPWGWVGTLLIAGHFLFPFAFLMSRHMKRNRITLGFAAAFLLVMHWFDMQYLIMPTLHHDGMVLSWLDATAMLGVVGIAGGLLFRSIAKHPLIPERDPRLPESLHFHNI